MKTILALVIIFFTFFQFKVYANPIKVFNDSDTGYEVWQMTDNSAFESTDYYTNLAYSPNGKYIAFLSSAFYPSYLGIVSTNGSVYEQFGSSSSWNSIKSQYNISDLYDYTAGWGWWSNDGAKYYTRNGLFVIDTDTKQISKLSNQSFANSFYYPMVSPDGKTLFGIANKYDTTSKGTLKFINVDGRNYRQVQAPNQPSGTGFDVSHGWVGHNNAWYLNNSVNDLYRDIVRVVDSQSLTYKGSLEATESQTDWTGIFDHPAISNSGYFVGGKNGLISGFGKYWGIANTDYTTNNPTSRGLKRVVDSSKYPQFSSVASVHLNISNDDKWLVTGNVRGNCSALAVYPTSINSSPFFVASFGPSTVCEQNSGYGPYAMFSPDSTKILFASNYQLPNRNTKKSGSNVDLYQVVFAKPNTPSEISFSNNQLVFKQSQYNKEIKQYNLYEANEKLGTYNFKKSIEVAQTFLNNNSMLNETDTTIQVDNTGSFEIPGFIEIAGLSNSTPKEVVYCTQKTPTEFTNCTRGVEQTEKAKHYNDAFVWQYTNKHGFKDLSNNKWYKIEAQEWSGLKSNLSQPVLSSTNNPTPTVTTTPNYNQKFDVNEDSVVNLQDVIDLIKHMFVAN